MRKKLSYSFFIIGIIFCIFLLLPRSHSETVIEKKNNHINKRILEDLQKNELENGMFTFITGLEDTRDLYTTFLSYHLKELMGEPLHENHCDIFVNQVELNNDENMISNIELIYSLNLVCKENKTLQEVLITLAEQSHLEEGYFLSYEFQNSESNDLPISVKLHQTHLLLLLLDEYNKLHLYNNENIENWLIDQLNKESVTNSYFLSFKTLDSLEILGSTKVMNQLSLINNHMGNVKFLRNKDLSIYELLELEGYLQLTQMGFLEYDQVEITQIVHTLKENLNATILDIEKIYRIVHLLDTLGEDVSISFKNTQVNYIDMYMNDSYLPIITYYEPSYIITLMTMMTLLTLNNGTEYMTELTQLLKSEIEQISFNKMRDNLAELYSIIILHDILDLKTLSTEQKEEIIATILVEIKHMELNSNTLLTWSRAVNILTALDYQMSDQKLRENYLSVLKKVLEQGNYFDNGSLLFELIFLDTLILHGMTIEETDEIIQYVKNVNLKEYPDAAAYLLYYKYVILYRLDAEVEEHTLLSKIDSLYRDYGYALGHNDQFKDLRATFLLVQLKHYKENRGEFKNEIR